MAFSTSTKIFQALPSSKIVWQTRVLVNWIDVCVVERSLIYGDGANCKGEHAETARRIRKGEIIGLCNVDVLYQGVKVEQGHPLQKMEDEGLLQLPNCADIRVEKLITTAVAQGKELFFCSHLVVVESRRFIPGLEWEVRWGSETENRWPGRDSLSSSLAKRKVELRCRHDMLKIPS